MKATGTSRMMAGRDDAGGWPVPALGCAGNPAETTAESQARAAICEITVALAVARHGGNLKAVVLTGSLARKEATFLRDGAGWKQLGDSEFFLVYRDDAPLPSCDELRTLENEIEARLLRRNIKGRISLSAIRSAYLRRLQPAIFAYELMANGSVLWGEPVLSLIPRFTPDAIPLEDAWRLLANRMIELLEASLMLTSASQELPKEAIYQAAKLYIDMGTSFLVFAGGYEPTYAARAQKMAALLSEKGAAESCPLDTARFAERVVACTRWKLFAATRPLPLEAGRNSREFWEEAITDARALWRWELMRLTGAGENLSDQRLMSKYMREQPRSQRFRGWLFVLRREGWGRSWQKWPGWISHAFEGSPRYWVYASASELLFKLPEVTAAGYRGDAQENAAHQAHSWLPVARGVSPTGARDWRTHASDIAWNYHRFLEGTRS